MAQLISKNSKRKYGFTPAIIPQLSTEKTNEAHIPLVQPDGSVKYISEKDLKWMADNGLTSQVPSS